MNDFISALRVLKSQYQKIDNVDDLEDIEELVECYLNPGSDDEELEACERAITEILNDYKCK